MPDVTVDEQAETELMDLVKQRNAIEKTNQDYETERKRLREALRALDEAQKEYRKNLEAMDAQITEAMRKVK
jgi:hypothetical protein